MWIRVDLHFQVERVLIIGAVAAMERELLIERTQSGLAAARARGRGRWSAARLHSGTTAGRSAAVRLEVAIV